MIRNYILTVFICTVGIKSQIVSNGNNRPQVETTNGLIEGAWRTAFSGRRYAAFEGIPFAKPPLGHLRFREPQPVEPWLGVWNATRIYVCPQSTMDLTVRVEGNEDCLYINVYVPIESDKKPLDVVAHIHGGGFMLGFSQQFLNDKLIMDKDIILVSFNYRLGSLGFLSTEDEVVPGNNGLKDQALALKWIEGNIAKFGGNPKSVTITGFSAGAASVHLHYFSPLSKGLFHRGISTSGTAVASWAVVQNPLKTARALAKHVGCDLSDTRHMVDCLRQRPATLLVEKTKENLHGFSPMPCCPFAPVVEKWGKTPFINDHPYKLLNAGKVHDVPWITSVTSEDGMVISTSVDSKLEELNEKWLDTAAPHVLHCEGITPESKKRQIFEKVKQHYGSLYDQDDSISSDELTKLSTDWTFLVPAHRAVQMQAKVTKSPVYFYIFSYEGENSVRYIVSQDPKFKGTFHGDDMIYLFGAAVMKPMSERDTKLKEAFMDFLHSYASKGVPIFNKTEWEPINDELVYYLIKGPDDITKHVEKDFVSKKFWDELGFFQAENLIAQKDEL